MKSSKWNIASTTIAIFAFICITLSLIIIIITPPASRYEISIYDAYPWYFWLFLITSVFLGQILVLTNVFYKSKNQNYRIWIFGVIAIIIPIIILLFMPIIRGYITYGNGDNLYHIGAIKGILQTGRFDTGNFYPNMHILATSFIQISGSNVFDAANFIPRFFFFLTPIFLYLFFNIIFKKKDEMKLALILGSFILFFSYCDLYLFQYAQSFLIIPLILYLYFKRGSLERNVGFSILLVILIFSYNFYHPINSLLLILVLVIIIIILYLLPKITSEDNNINFSLSLIKERSINTTLIVALVFFVWYFSFSYVVGNFYRVFSSIFKRSEVSFIGSQAKIVETYKPQFLDLMRILLLNYGIFLSMALISIICILYILVKQYQNKQKFKFNFCLIFSILNLIVFVLLTGWEILAASIVEWERFATWAYLFSFIAISPVIYSIIFSNKFRNGIFKFITKSFKIAIMCIILMSLTGISVFSLYRAPLASEANMQVTSMDLKGVEWILDNRNHQILINQFGIDQWRYSDAIHEYNLSEQETRRHGITAPNHFNYNNTTSLGEYYHINCYLIITRMGKIFYPEVYPEYKSKWRFESKDFDTLQNDNTVNRIYYNGDFEAYMIKPILN